VPGHHLDDDAKDVVRLGTGLISTIAGHRVKLPLTEFPASDAAGATEEHPEERAAEDDRERDQRHCQGAHGLPSSYDLDVSGSPQERTFA
jgi:hypothetical protein